MSIYSINYLTKFYTRMVEHYQAKYLNAVVHNKHAKAKLCASLLLKYQYRLNKLNSINQSPINI